MWGRLFADASVRGVSRKQSSHAGVGAGDTQAYDRRPTFPAHSLLLVHLALVARLRRPARHSLWSGDFRVSSRRPIAAARAAVLAAGLLACGESTEPSREIRGSFQLVSVNGSPLPYAYVSRVVEGMLTEYRVLDGRMEFRTRQRVFDIRSLTFLSTRPDTLVSGYRVDGTRLFLSRSSTVPLPAYTDTGTIEPSVLTMRMQHLDGAPNVGAVFVYVRVVS